MVWWRRQPCRVPTSRLPRARRAWWCTSPAARGWVGPKARCQPVGATGGQGGAVAAALLARGGRVRVMVGRPGDPRVRRLAERGVEVANPSGDGPAHPTAVKSVHGDRQKTDPDDGVRGARAAPTIRTRLKHILRSTARGAEEAQIDSTGARVAPIRGMTRSLTASG